MQELIREPINTNLLQRYIDEWLSHVNTTHNWKRLHQILSNLLTGVISATDTHIGSTNLTLTSNRLLSGDGNNFSIEDLGYFTVISNNDMIFGTSANFNTIGASYYINVTGDYILNLPSATNAPVGAPLLNQTFGVGDVEFANYGFPTSLSGMDNGKMLVYNSTINQFVTQSLGVVTNIYNSDGTLSSDRQLTGDEHDLTFGLPDDDLNATSDIPIFTVNAGNIIFNAGAEIQLNTLEGESVLISTAGLGIFTDSIFFGGESLGLPANPTPQMFLVLDGAINTGNLSVSTVAEMQTALGIGSAALTAGYIAYGTGTGITGEAALFYDATNDRLGIGTATPTVKLNLLQTTAATNSVVDIASFDLTTSGLAATGLGVQTIYRVEGSDGLLKTVAGISGVFDDSPTPDGGILYLSAGYNGTLATPTVKIVPTATTTNGTLTNVIGVGGVEQGIESTRYTDTPTQPAYIGYRRARGTEALPTTLVTGDLLGRLGFGGYDGAAWRYMANIDVGTSGTIGLNRIPTYMTFSTATDAATSVLTERMRITASGLITLQGITSAFPALKRSGTGLEIRLADDSAYAPLTCWTLNTSSTITSGSAIIASGGNSTINTQGSYSATSGTNNAFDVLKNFSPTSGTGIFNAFSFKGTINQTGGANGISRGIYIAPTLTAAADFRAIEITEGTINVSKTITTAGTTGAQTINKIAGQVNFAAAATTLVVTNSLVTVNSIVMVQVLGTDLTFTSARVTKAAGSFTITANAAATAETAVSFFVIN